MVQFVAGSGQLAPADDPAVAGRGRVGVKHRDRVLHLAVRVPMNSWRPISAAVWPRAASRATSNSLGVSAAGPRPATAARRPRYPRLASRLATRLRRTTAPHPWYELAARESISMAAPRD